MSSLSWPAVVGTYITTSNGTLGNVGNGAFTLIALIKPASTGGTAAIGMQVSSSNDIQIIVDTGVWYGGGDFSGFGTATTDWQIIGQSKASGTNVLRWHYYNYTTGGSKTHTDGTGTHANPGTITTIRLGEGDNRGNGLIAAVAVWKRVLADAEFDSLCTTNLSDWMAVSGGAPDAIWALNVVAASVVDGTGNGANEASVSGTISLTGADPPGFNYTLTAAAGATAAPILIAPGRSGPGGRWQLPPSDFTTSTAATSAPAEVTTATGAAFDAVAALGVNAEQAASTGAASDAQGAAGVNAEATAATATAAAPASDLQANAGNAAATATANDGQAAETVNAEGITAAGTAYDATVSTSANVNAPAEATSATGTAYDAGAALASNGEATAATGTAFDAAIAAAVNAEATSGTGSAPAPVASPGAAADFAAAAGTASAAALAIQAGAEAAAVLGAALDATVTLGGSGSVSAGSAAAAGAAYNARVQKLILRPNSGITARPDTGITARPDTGITQRP